MASLFRWGSKEKGKDYFSTAFFNTTPTVFLTEEQVMKIPAVKASVELISSSISQLPIYLYIEHDDTSTEKMDDPRISVLNHEANDFDTAQVIKKKVVQDYLLRGKAYLYHKDNKLHHLPAKSVKEELYTEDGITVAKKQFNYTGMSNVTLEEDEVIVIDSGTDGLLVDAGELLKSALAQQEYSQSILSNGALPAGILQTATRLTENAMSRLRESWKSLYQGSKQAGKTVILEEGLEFKPITLKPDEMQMTETHKILVSEIARVFNIPESMINSAANKYNSLEQNNLQFLQNCVGPIITAIESALDKNLLTRIEKDTGFYFRFDTSELLRTTEKEKVETVSSALKGGLISFNEARHKLDMSPVEEDYFVLSLGNVLKSAKTNELTILNLNQTSNGGEINNNGQEGKD
ncbi:phage portal protein [Halalkalibacter krulwichiae]|uniref:Phage portal protein n=1 Tax=Halalkalibacter krulwichiae TaxID=199441 RepID=A0A1X9M6H6_9BACI|nr:phage portal protein [Halalkalibacter krulwichiae]ARK29045.1 Phage portal protein [Halalkalibacter krulwichiae]